VFPVRYGLNSYLLFGRNSVFKGLIELYGGVCLEAMVRRTKQGLSVGTAGVSAEIRTPNATLERHRHLLRSVQCLQCMLSVCLSLSVCRSLTSSPASAQCGSARLWSVERNPDKLATETSSRKNMRSPPTALHGVKFSRL
jgi:hypothetical protein